jgi:hypothetical protein
MSEHPAAVLAAAEGAAAEIAWIVVLVLCWFLMIAPFALWYAGVRTPRAERRARRAGAELTNPAPTRPANAEEVPTRVVG